MSEHVNLRGVDSIKFDSQQGGSPLGLATDMRPLGMRYHFFLQTILPLALALVFLLLAMVVSTFSEVFILFSVFFARQWGVKRGKYLNSSSELFDKPKYLNYNKKAARADFSPKENVKDVKKAAPGIGGGVYFFGHELNTNQEVHISDDKVRTHIIIFGTTGAGKTETILSMCVNFLTQSSGFILCDGKGDTLLFAKCFAVCRAFGRTDDLYLLNFMDEGIPDGVKRVEDITNTFNFLVDSTAAEADEIIGGLLPSDEGGGSGMWEGRAATGINSINKAVYFLKDNGYLEVDPDTYRTYFALDEFVELASNDAIPKDRRAGLWSLLNSINYKIPTAQDPNPKQNPATEEQFQYITMQYTETFNMLAEQYRHITVSQVPDISITDVVLRRRILLVLLPSLAKSPQSVRNLGRIVIAMTRNVSSKAIGSQVEGDYKTVIESKPTAAISSFGLIFDEFGTYATKGASTLPAQVRSLNMVCLFAGQDYEAFKRGDEIEAATIFANCTLKLCMKLEDPLTYEKFKDSAGEEYVVSADSYEAKETMFGRKYTKAKTARIEKRPVLDLKDLKAQQAGWGTLIFGSTVHRIKSFYADPHMPGKARLNHFLEIRRPGHADVQTMRKGVDQLYRRLKKRIDGDWEGEEATTDRLISTFSSSFDELTNIFDKVEKHGVDHPDTPQASETELAVFALSAYLKKVEMVDRSITNSLKASIGVETDDNDGYDDDDLLSDDGEDLFGYEPPANTLSPPISEPSSYPGDALDEIDRATHEPVAAALPRSTTSDEKEQAMFAQIEKAIDKRQVLLAKAEQLSFNSLEAINMNVFETRQRVATLEAALLTRNSEPVADIAKMSQLTAKNLVVDMGLKTNVAVASEKDRKIKTSSRSSNEVKSMITGVLTRKKEGSND
jgi:hypothetical protein